MKRKVVLLLALALCLSISACRNQGTISNVVIDYGYSILYCEAEIKSAIEAVLKKFKDFKGCALIKLW